jgi:hypothetical protein
VHAWSIVSYITLHCITLHGITLHYTTLHYITPHHTTLHYTRIHYPTLRYIPLHDLHHLSATSTIGCRATLAWFSQGSAAAVATSALYARHDQVPVGFETGDSRSAAALEEPALRLPGLLSFRGGGVRVCGCARSLQAAQAGTRGAEGSEGKLILQPAAVTSSESARVVLESFRVRCPCLIGKCPCFAPPLSNSGCAGQTLNQRLVQPGARERSCAPG